MKMQNIIQHVLRIWEQLEPVGAFMKENHRDTRHMQEQYHIKNVWL